MSPEEQAAGRAALERLKRFAAGAPISTIYPTELFRLDAVRKDLSLVFSALRRREDASV